MALKKIFLSLNRVLKNHPQTAHITSEEVKDLNLNCRKYSSLLFGHGEAKGELKKRLEDDHIAHLIQAVETVAQMTDRQIAAKVREYFN